MPGFDGTGPRGQGPMTGGGRGFCNFNFAGMGGPNMGYPYGTPFSGYPYENQPYSPYQAYPCRGFGMGRGLGRGLGMRRGLGRGLGMGKGMGRGMGRGFGW
ncbi:MAG: DUF5320 domain-containing protein [Pseudomonadota bacterium]